MDFTSYMKAENILKQQEIKEAIALIPKILNLCIKKDLDFSLNIGSKVIDVSNLKTGYCLTGYYDIDLINYENPESKTFKIKTIYEKVKSYNV